MKKFLSILCCFSMVVGLYTVRTAAVDEPITKDNYSDNVEVLENQLNGDNVIPSTTSEDYTFGKYGRLHFDGWNVTVVDFKADGMHMTMKFKADEGYKLPSRMNSRFLGFEYDITSAEPFSYSVMDGVATLDFYVCEKPNDDGGLIIGGGSGGLGTSEEKDVYYATPVMVYLAAIEENVNESEYLKGFVFAAVRHKANYKTGYLGYEHTIDGLDFRLNGSRTYLVKAGSTLKIYTREQVGFAPMEVSSDKKTGVSDNNATDYRNRYFVFDVKGNNVSWYDVFYQPTYFTINIYDYNVGQWVRVGAYDYYHQDNNIKLSDLLTNRFNLSDKQITSFNVQTYVYDQTMTQVQTRKLISEEVDLNYTLSTLASNFDVQWTNTGVDKIDGSDDSSLRIRQGDLYVTPRFTNEYTVTFIDYNGDVLGSDVVLAGEDATAPADPKRDDYEFAGWDRDFTNVQTDLIVRALYNQTAFTVTFVDHDGTVLSTQKVQKDNSAVAPANPTREGYVFTGWDVDFSNVQSDLTVTAMYDEIPEVTLFTVTFVDFDGTVLDTQQVEQGNDAVAPTNPAREGYTFAGWDVEFTNVQSDLTVRALYNPIVETFTVTFVDYNGDVLSIQEVVRGNAAVAPENPTREGYVFTGWDVDFNNIQSDLTVTALYEEVEPEEPVVPVLSPETPLPPVNPTLTPTPTPTPEPIEIPENPTPLVPVTPEPEPEPVVLPDTPTPLAPSGGSWALVNLIASAITVLLGVAILLGKLKKEEEREEEDQLQTDEEEKDAFKRRRWTKVLGTLIAILSVIVFILTEDMSLPMCMVDKWTILMVVMALANVVVLVVGRKWKDNNEEDDHQMQTA